MPQTKEQRLKERADGLGLAPRSDDLAAIIRHWTPKHVRMDEQLAAIWAEKLRHTYTDPYETVYPELKAAMGDVLPIDSSMPPAAEEWESFAIDHRGFATWIGDDGEFAPNGAIEARRITGRAHEIGHVYDLNKFDLERAAMANVPLSAMKSKYARKYHEVKTNWVWLFGDVSKELPGLCNHPNIPVVVAADGAGGGSNPAHFSVKSVDEIAADFAALIDVVETDTIGAYKVAKIFYPRTLGHRMRNLRLGAGDGYASLEGLIKDRYKDIEFVELNECEAANRSDPELAGVDTSGITGDFMLACPPKNVDEASFVKARPFSTLPPEEKGFQIKNYTHSKIGSARILVPPSFRRLDFGAVPT